MLHRTIRPSVVAIILAIGAVSMLPAGVARGEDPDPKRAARAHWENTVVWYMEEESSESSLRVRDQDVHERAWFKFFELWQFIPKEGRWVQLKTEKMEKAIVLPKQKGSDQPEGSQTLIELRDIEPKTAGLWFAKWAVDDVPGSTFMKIGGARAKNQLEEKAGRGMLRQVVPLDLEHSELMNIPDPRIYCVAGGPGKPTPGEKPGK